MQPLIINPQIRILCRKGRFYAVQLSGRRPPLLLEDTDFVLLAEFLSARAGTEAARDVVFGLRRVHSENVPTLNAIRRRIRQFEQTEVLLQGSTPRRESMPRGKLEFGSCPGTGAMPDGSFGLAKSFLLYPERDGFAVWSSRDRCYMVLDLPMLRLLGAFAVVTKPSNLIQDVSDAGEQHQIANAVCAAKQKGLIVQAHNRSAPSGFRRKAVRKQPLRPGTTTWHDQTADDRIPIYFTPHMQNHYPLALGMMRSAIESYDSGSLLNRFQPVPLTYLTQEEMLRGPYQKFGPGVWLFSNYMWSIDQNLKVSEAVKSHDPSNLCIHGGPSTPSYSASCAQFMRTNASVDIAVHGEGEACMPEMLRCISSAESDSARFDIESLREVAGISFPDRRTGELIWTAPRTRMRDLDVIPSPYLTGAFDAYEGHVEAAIIETNRGCPFGCTFCDWGSATSEKVRKFNLQRVREEIEWIASRSVNVLWIADANFGMYDRDIEISKMIVDARARLGYPQEVVVNYTKNTNKRLVEIVRILSEGGIISQGIISIQTTDEKTLKVINRTNIKTEKYDELAQIFADSRLPLSVDLMIGLPGITREAWRRDLQRYFDSDVVVKAYPTRLLPNSPMANPEYMTKYSIEVNDSGFIAACNSFTRQDLEEMKQIYRLFTLADGYGLLRYVLRYLQWDHGIDALDFLGQWLDVVNREPERYPTLTWVARVFASEKVVPGGWHDFYLAVAEFIQSEFSINDDSALSVALEVNEITMPDEVLRYPVTRSLKHDFVAYFKNQKAGSGAQLRLADYPPGSLTVEDPDLMAQRDMDSEQYDSHQFFWELRSEVSRVRSSAEFADRRSA